MVKVAIIGFGSMGFIILKLLKNKNAEITDIFNRSSHVGKDAGDIAGIGNIGVTIKAISEADQVFSENKPDICMLQSVTDIHAIKPNLELCAKHSINVLTLAESLFYPWHQYPAESADLDKLFKEAGCTLTAAGYQDGFYGDLLLTLAGSANNIRGVSGRMVSDIHNYLQGSEEVRKQLHRDVIGIGYNAAEFDEKVGKPYEEKEKEVPGGFIGTAVHKVVDSFGWNFKDWSVKYSPVMSEKAHDLGWGIVQPGFAVGLAVDYHIQTKEGPFVKFHAELTSLLPGETDTNDWTIHADPDVNLSTNPAHISAFTNTSYVNRIPDVIKAPPGLITTDKLGAPRYVASLANV